MLVDIVKWSLGNKLTFNLELSAYRFLEGNGKIYFCNLLYDYQRSFALLPDENGKGHFGETNDPPQGRVNQNLCDLCHFQVFVG